MTLPGLVPTETPDLASYDVILVNTSGGKDSQAMLGHVVHMAALDGVLHRVEAVHADLGRVEWPGTKELAGRQCAHYGVRLHYVARSKDLLHQIEFERKKFPDSARRYCTSDHKRDQVKPLLTRLARECRAGRWFGTHFVQVTGQPVRILNCMGMRAAESAKRSTLAVLEVERDNRNVLVERWLPIFDWGVGDVWDHIAGSGVEHHPAYDAGMPRLSCSFCILATKPALVRAAQLRPDLAAEYAGIEERIGHSFKQNLSMADIIEAARTAPVDAPIPTWEA